MFARFSVPLPIPLFRYCYHSRRSLVSLLVWLGKRFLLQACGRHRKETGPGAWGGGGRTTRRTGKIICVRMQNKEEASVLSCYLWIRARWWGWWGELRFSLPTKAWFLILLEPKEGWRRLANAHQTPAGVDSLWGGGVCLLDNMHHPTTPSSCGFLGFVSQYVPWYFGAWLL